jgi:tungstate transport system ATP-binding protein
MTLTPPLYEIRDLEHRYAGRSVLEVDRLDVQAGAILGLVGPNGSGKSTLLRILGAIETPVQGRLRFAGSPLKPFSEDARRRICLLPQEPYLMKRSVFANVAYGLRLRRDTAKLDDRIGEALSLVGLSADRFSRRPWYALSGGEAQRVALAARLILRPRVLLLDEPTASVDALSAQLIKEASLNARREWGTTLVVASHDLQWLAEICDGLLHLFNGRVIRPGGGAIVFGPWEAVGDGFWRKALGGKQWLMTGEPPHPEAVARIALAAVDGEDPTRDPGVRLLYGTLTQLRWNRTNGGITAIVRVGHETVAVTLSAEEVRERGLLPGGPIRVAYRPDRVEWL